MSAWAWDFCGNAEAVYRLQTGIAHQSVRHAYLFGGSARVGKSTLARRFSQALLCEQPLHGVDPCLNCGECLRIEKGVHPDVLTYSIEAQRRLSVDGAAKGTSLTIETIRAVTGEAAMRPLNARWRVIIIEDSETMQAPAQEAFLKTLEEPPIYLVLILLSDSPELLLPTIRSRCEFIDLRCVPPKEIEDFLAAYKLSTIPEAARLAAGSPGWAIGSARGSQLLTERLQIAERASAWINSTPFDRIVGAFQIGDQFSRQRNETVTVLETTAGLWRDAILAKSGNSDRIIYSGQARQTKFLAGIFEMDQLVSAARSVLTCIKDLQGNVRPRLALEAMVLQWPTIPEWPGQ
jgi:DNA polymerase-3 subunit delta'